jgi:hypothetical protein
MCTPSATDLAFGTAGSTETVATEWGLLNVTICGDRTLSPCIAYHEVGLSPRTCFQSLVVAAGPQSLLRKHFYFLFITAPGCQVSSSFSESNLRALHARNLQ